MKGKDRFSDKVVVITGASSGIGRATAHAFAREGAKTVLVSRSREKLERVRAEIAGYNPNVMVVPTNVSNEEEVREMANRVLDEFGRIDVLFTNAGKALVGAVDNRNFIKDTRDMIDVDLFGTLFSVKEVLPAMQKQGSGHIAIMSSVVGKKAFPKFGGYSISMHAVSAFADALRQELDGSGIRVSTIHPALTQTPLLTSVDTADMPPPFRYMTPIKVEAVAKAVLNAVATNRRRVVVPSQPRVLMLADAVSPWLGDMFVKLLPNKTFASLIGMYRGRTYEHGAETGDAKVGRGGGEVERAGAR